MNQNKFLVLCFLILVCCPSFLFIFGTPPTHSDSIDTVTKVVTTWTQEPPCINGAGHGDGICGDSSSSCWDCNCSLVIEKWCDNETLELERIRQSTNAGYNDCCGSMGGGGCVGDNCTESREE